MVEYRVETGSVRPTGPRATDVRRFDSSAREDERAVQIWGYCAGCDDWFVCPRGVNGVVASWTCPVCGLQPASIEQWDCTDAGHPRLDAETSGETASPSTQPDERRPAAARS